ncbi:hypothetical protein [Elizabethkingia ursingii]|uniref:hypothetical protein n=1 Tax=Elizabethkingia ursingii TaxID=1756150 RepID=UPI000750807E|nr:hypothetical protein [Elizabethkingia ursingii]KUY29886.1 hypothetical protein ATB96_17570 [Elizabethkingia ursingii]
MIKGLSSKQTRSSWQLLFSFGILFMFGILFLGGVEVLLRQHKDYHFKEKQISENQSNEYLVFLKLRKEMTLKEKQELIKRFISLKNTSNNEKPAIISIKNRNGENSDTLKGNYKVLFKVSVLAGDPDANTSNTP